MVNQKDAETRQRTIWGPAGILGATLLLLAAPWSLESHAMGFWLSWNWLSLPLLSTAACQVCWGESLHCALLLDYVPPKEPPSTPLGNALRIR